MAKFKKWLHRMAGGNNVELRHAVLRLVTVTLSLCYVFLTQGIQYESFSEPKTILQTIGLLSVSFSLLILVHTHKNPGIHFWRRAIGLLHDAVLLTAVLYFGEEMATVFLFLYPFSAIGYGFRYGEKWLLASTLCGAIGLAILVSTSSFWSELPMIGTGFAITFLTVVTYTGLLLRKLRGTTAQLEKMATHDSLTGLPNRRFVMEQLRQAFEANQRNQQTLTCIYFDLDGFKSVNDTLGHGAGDILLKEVAVRARSLICEKDVVARLGGDEFTIIRTSVVSPHEAEELCRKLVDSVQDITEIMGHPIVISASVGCVLVPAGIHSQEKEPTEEVIMRLADACMYQSKKSGRGQYTITDHGTGLIRVVAS